MKIAALDIGSNSLHLVVVETDQEKPFRVLASGKEMVRLARSVARDRRLSSAATERAIAAIRRFRKTADAHGAKEIIAVTTSAVREAENRQEFLVQVLEETGVRIDLLSGVEEARLIALAVSHRQRLRRNQRMLVIDIGGGSTEFAVTRNDEPEVLVSLKLGAVRMTEQFVASDPISDKQLRRLRSELRSIVAQRAPEIAAAGFDLCYGTSGTINALGLLATQRRGRNAARRGEISLTLEELEAINEELAGLNLSERARVASLSRARAEIIVAGGQILEAAMETLGIRELSVCDWALREGVVIAHLMRRGAKAAALPARLERDPSLRGALALAAHFQADLKHAHRVAYLAQELFNGLRPLHGLGGEHLRLLLAAAILHDIGYVVSHVDHHKHSAYLIQHGEFAGFTDAEIAILANVARYHRSSLPKARHADYAALPGEDRAIVRKLAALLRIADALDRDHKGQVRAIHCEIREKTVRITAACSRESESAQWRVEERADLFGEEFGLPIELIAETKVD
jgi:exopolyphosphatase/guanosine-5'-triphosphate,3'-diphosphate pyrophosphatase